ncbi:MAG: hypothetical protein JXA21_29370 [Anaerolineae bacterium]|nr:hypothetical protein [Anaerolineae bacterium]
MTKQDNPGNVYMEQVLEEQEKVARQLNKRRMAAPAMDMKDMASAPSPMQPQSHGSVAPVSLRPADYHITGFWLWQTVVVTPNVYVVHTRRGHKDPVHIGMGISFPYNPRTDAFLVIPAAMQTILINANCICRERQGILVQGYVQWIIEDINTAYRKLDFTDPEDPMGVVNVQLREQAEAAIKDKVATMSIDEVLSDKQPIIEELTLRLRVVAEGSRNEGSSGLGLKIVTVQIKEAVVSSSRLWENLQAPFRAEREKFARLAELESRQEINARELENRETREKEELSVEGRLAKLRADQEQAQYDREQSERTRRHHVEQEAERQSITERNNTEKARNAAKLELALQAVEQEKRRIAAEVDKVQQQMKLTEVTAQMTRAEVRTELEMQELRNMAQTAQAERQLKLRQIEHQIENDISEESLQSQLIAQLPEVAEHLPKPEEQRTIIVTGDADNPLNSLLGFVAGAMNVLKDAWKGE